MDIRRAPGFLSGFCVEPADSSGVFHPLAGGGSQIPDFVGCFSEKELDAAAEFLNNHALLADINSNSCKGGKSGCWELRQKDLPFRQHHGGYEYGYESGDESGRGIRSF